MKIAFDLRRIGNPGIGRYMKSLVEAVLAGAPEHEYLLILPRDREAMIEAQGTNVERVLAVSPCYSLQEQIEVPRLLRRHKVDLLHSPHFNVPLFAPCPAVVTLHDVIYLACKQDLPSRLGRLYYRGMMTAAIRRARRVITVSEFSKREIVRYLRAAPEKIDVIYSGVDRGFQPLTDPSRIEQTLARYNIAGDYILYAGIYKPRKNHAGLLRAFREFLATGDPAQLVIAGPMAEGEQGLRALADGLGVAKSAIFTGFVPDSDLLALYSAARVYACPSLYEGFGFTVLEAMACGVPVVCSRESALPEVAGEAALYADARDPHAFAVALRQAFFDVELRGPLIANGLKNRSQFSWQKCAQATVATYERAAGFLTEQAALA